MEIYAVLESSASIQWIENEIKRLPRPLLVRFFFSVILTVNKHLPRPLGFFSIISMDSKRLLTRFFQPYFTD